MAAQRCGTCNVNYPTDTKPSYCRICGGELKYRGNEDADDNWHDLVVQRLRARHPHKYVEWEGAHPKTDALISVLEVPISGNQTLHFIPHQELLDMGYLYLESFSIVRCNGRFYELQGYNPAVDAWWVEEIKLPEEESDSGRQLETMGEGGSEGPRGDAQRPSGE